MVFVDGRSRDACFIEALKPGLLRDDYGIIILDNAERAKYRAPDNVPSSWLAVSFRNAVDETSIWMSCPEKDAHCDCARKEIDNFMQLVYTMIGWWYIVY